MTDDVLTTPPPRGGIAPALPPPAGRGSTREVATLAAPAVMSMLSVTLMWTSDTFFVGRLGTAEQGGVGFAGVIAWTILSFWNGLLTAVQVFVAQHVGAGSKRGAGEMTWQGIGIGILAAFPVIAVAFLGDRILAALHVDPALLPHAVTYFQIRLLGGGAVFIAFACEGYLRGVGDTRTPMLVTFLANGINIGLDYLLIFGHLGFPRLGVAGSAWGTVAASAVQAAILFVMFERRALRDGHLERAYVPFRLSSLLKLVRVGVLVGAQWVLDMGSWTTFTVITAQIGEVQAAAHQVATAIIHVSFMPGYGISVAATTLVGQYLGAGDRAAALRSARNALKIAVAFMGTMGLVFLLMRHDLVRIFNVDPAVVAVGGTLLVFAAVFQMFDAVNLVLSGVLRGAGDTRYPIIATIIMAWIVFVPLAWLLSVRLGMGVAGGWAAVIMWAAGLAAVLWHRFARRKWLDMLLVDRAETAAPAGVAAAGGAAVAAEAP